MLDPRQTSDEQLIGREIEDIDAEDLASLEVPESEVWEEELDAPGEQEPAPQGHVIA